MHPLATVLFFLTLAIFGDAVPSNIDTTRLVQPTKGEPLGTILGISWVSIAYFFAAMSGSALVLLILMQTVSTWGWWRLKGQGEKPAMVRTWHGWVTREEYDKKQAKRDHRALNKQYFFWKSTKANYTWLWWDPGNKGRNRFYAHREQSHLRYIPSFLRSRPLEDIQSRTENGSLPGGPSLQMGIHPSVCIRDISTNYDNAQREGERTMMSSALQGAPILRQRQSRIGSLPTLPGCGYLTSIIASSQGSLTENVRPSPRDKPSNDLCKQYLPPGLDGRMNKRHVRCATDPVTSPRKVPLTSSVLYTSSTSMGSLPLVVESKGVGYRPQPGVVTVHRETVRKKSGSQLSPVPEENEPVHWYGGSRGADARVAYPMQGLDSTDGLDMTGELIGVLSGFGPEM